MTDQISGPQTPRLRFCDCSQRHHTFAMMEIPGVTDPARILYGTDWPYAPEPATAQGAALPRTKDGSPGPGHDAYR